MKDTVEPGPKGERMHILGLDHQLFHAADEPSQTAFSGQYVHLFERSTTASPVQLSTLIHSTHLF